MPTASPIEHDILATTDNGRPNEHLVPRYRPKTIVLRTVVEIKAKWRLKFCRRSQSSRLTARGYNKCPKTVTFKTKIVK